MALANNTVLVTPGSGATFATHSPGSGTTEFHVCIPASAAGHLAETEATYTVTLPELNGGANRYHWELFNGSGSTYTVLVRAIYQMSSADTTTSNNLGLRFDLFRTTAFSSGGSAHREDSSSSLSANFARWDTQDRTLPSGISLKTVLTSITTGAWLGQRHSPTAVTAARWESTMANWFNRAGYETLNDPGADYMSGKALTLRPGEGIACRQGTVNSTMTWTWRLQFTTI